MLRTEEFTTHVSHDYHPQAITKSLLEFFTENNAYTLNPRKTYAKLVIVNLETSLGNMLIKLIL